MNFLIKWTKTFFLGSSVKLSFTNCVLWFGTVKSYIFPKFPFFFLFSPLISFPISRPWIIYRPGSFISIWCPVHSVSTYKNIIFFPKNHIFTYYLEHKYIAKHFKQYLPQKWKNLMKISEILKQHQISDQMVPTAFF